MVHCLRLFFGFLFLSVFVVDGMDALSEHRMQERLDFKRACHVRCRDILIALVRSSGTGILMHQCIEHGLVLDGDRPEYRHDIWDIYANPLYDHKPSLKDPETCGPLGPGHTRCILQICRILALTSHPVASCAVIENYFGSMTNFHQMLAEITPITLFEHACICRNRGLQLFLTQPRLSNL